MLPKPDNSQILWGAAAVPHFTDESFASFPYPSIIKCSFGKFYFTKLIIQIQFRNITILHAAALAIYKPSVKRPLYNFPKAKICFPAVCVQYVGINVESGMITSLSAIKWNSAALATSLESWLSDYRILGYKVLFCFSFNLFQIHGETTVMKRNL